MQIGIIGTGNIGGSLGKIWTGHGHSVVFGTRQPQSAEVQNLLQACGPKAQAGSVAEALAFGEVIALAVPWKAAEEIAKSVDNWNQKILIDCTNPIGPGFQLTVGHTSSGGEQVAQWANQARVVKAFNTTGWENVVNPHYGSQKADTYIAGDDASAKAIVRQLAQEIGFEVIDAGLLNASRYLEPLAMLWITLGRIQGQGADLTFKLLRR